MAPGHFDRLCHSSLPWAGGDQGCWLHCVLRGGCWSGWLDRCVERTVGHVYSHTAAQRVGREHLRVTAQRKEAWGVFRGGSLWTRTTFTGPEGSGQCRWPGRWVWGLIPLEGPTECPGGVAGGLREAKAASEGTHWGTGVLRWGRGAGRSALTPTKLRGQDTAETIIRFGRENSQRSESLLFVF